MSASDDKPAAVPGLPRSGGGSATAAAESETLPSQGFASRPYRPHCLPHTEGNLYAVVNHPSLYGATFVNDTVDDILRAKKLPVGHWVPVRSVDEIPEGHQPSLQWREYETIDWELPFRDGGGASNRSIADGYCNRKGLIRKAHMAKLVNRFVSKRPGTSLRKHFPQTVNASVDARRDWFAYSIADVVDAVECHEEEGWMWILKPSRLDREEHRVVTTAAEAEQVLREGAELLEWVCQRYIHNPLLVHGRKFHLRVNVLAVGALQVFVHRDSVLVSTAALPFDTSPAAMGNKYIHISNAVYARQYHGVDFDEAEFKFPLSELPQKLSTSPSGTSEIDLAVLFACICDVVRDLFEAASQDFNAFVPHSNSFELYGLDFVLDESGTPFLLECNSGCDWESMFGVRYQSLLQGLFQDTIAVAVDPVFTHEQSGGGGSADKAAGTAFIPVLDKLAGPVAGGGGMKWGAAENGQAPGDSKTVADQSSATQDTHGLASPGPGQVSAEEAAAHGVVAGSTSLRLWWAGSLYRAKIIAVNETEGTVRYKLLECIDDDSGSDSDEQYDSEEDPLDTGFLDRIEPV